MHLYLSFYFFISKQFLYCLLLLIYQGFIISTIKISFLYRRPVMLLFSNDPPVQVNTEMTPNSSQSWPFRTRPREESNVSCRPIQTANRLLAPASTLPARLTKSLYRDTRSRTHPVTLYRVLGRPWPSHKNGWSLALSRINLQSQDSS